MTVAPFIRDLVARGLSAHPAAAVSSSSDPSGEGTTAAGITVGDAIAGAVGLEKIVFALRQAIASRGLDPTSDVALGLDVLDEAAALIPEAAELDEAVHVAAVVVPVLIALRQAHPIGPTNVDPLGRGGRRG